MYRTRALMQVQAIAKWQSLEILTTTDNGIIQRQPKYTESTTRQTEVFYVPCLLTCFKISPIALFNRVTSLKILFNSATKHNEMHWQTYFSNFLKKTARIYFFIEGVFWNPIPPLNTCSPPPLGKNIWIRTFY